jgi:hypothetical protein
MIHKSGPQVGFNENKELRPDATNHAQHGPPEIKGHRKQKRDIVLQFPLCDRHALARGHGEYQFLFRKAFFERFDQRDGGEDFPHGKGMDPDGFVSLFAGAWNTLQPLDKPVVPQQRDKGPKKNDKKSPPQVVDE